jgi:hypothetical protein
MMMMMVWEKELARFGCGYFLSKSEYEIRQPESKVSLRASTEDMMQATTAAPHIGWLDTLSGDDSIPQIIRSYVSLIHILQSESKICFQEIIKILGSIKF